MNAPLTSRTSTVTITGHPLPAPVTLTHAQPDGTIHGHGWLLTVAQTVRLLDAWKSAPTRSDDDGGDVVRDRTYSESGLFVTALHMDGEIGLSVWESATGSDGDDLYSTVTMPFDFRISEAGEEER